MALTKTPVTTTDESEEIFAPAETGNLTINQENISHILSRLTSLYEDPILATARETISNALDATMKLPADDRRPVEVSVGQFDETFTVRDYGVGMTLDEIKNNFMRYSSSTKGDDFNAIGSYGLGSKAPLAYTPEFTVTSTRDGVTTAFKMSNTAAGFRYSILYTRETNRENGTVVAVPMKNYDRHRFTSVAESYQELAFDLPITVNGETASENHFVEVFEVVLDEDTDTRGRVWLDKRNIRYMTNRSTPDYAFVLSGYKYERMTAQRYYGRRISPLIVELKPALADFTSSRDTLAGTERTFELQERIESQIQAWDRLSSVDPVMESDISLADKYATVASALEHGADISKAKSELARAMASESVAGVSALGITFDWRGSSKTPKFFSDKLTDIVDDFSDSLQTGLYIKELVDSGSAVLVTGADESNITKIFRSRSRFVRKGVADDTLGRRGWIGITNDPQTPEMKLLEDAAGVKRYTADEFIAEAKKFDPPKDTTSESRDIYMTKFVLDTDDYRWSYARNAVFSTAEEVAAVKPAVIVTSASDYALRGFQNHLHNEGLTGKDGEHYSIAANTLTRAHYSLLADNGATFFIREGEVLNSIRSKFVSEELAKATVLKTAPLDALMNSISDTDYAALVGPRPYMVSDEFEKFIERVTGISDYGKSDCYSSWSEWVTNPREDAIERLGEDATDALILLRNSSVFRVLDDALDSDTPMDKVVAVFDALKEVNFS